MTASSHFDAYRKTPSFEPRSPDLTKKVSDDEIEDLSNDARVTSLEEAKTNTIPNFFDGAERDSDDVWISSDMVNNKYLWLVRTDDVKLALEDGTLRRTITDGRLKHTNLTDSLAHCGGELWFRDAQSIYLNGGSSRFAPRGSAELQAIVDSFCASGYAVCNFGWLEDTGQPKRVLRKADIKWQ